jgi:hypothetical protein
MKKKKSTPRQLPTNIGQMKNETFAFRLIHRQHDLNRQISMRVIRRLPGEFFFVSIPRMTEGIPKLTSS